MTEAVEETGKRLLLVAQRYDHLGAQTLRGRGVTGRPGLSAAIAASLFSFLRLAPTPTHIMTCRTRIIAPIAASTIRKTLIGDSG